MDSLVCCCSRKSDPRCQQRRNVNFSLQFSLGNSSQNWKRFKQKWSNYELATEVAKKDDAIRVATILTVIGDEAFDVYNTFTWDDEEDKVKFYVNCRNSRALIGYFFIVNMRTDA